jgi:hypothetical protein
VPSPFREEIRLSKAETFDVLVSLEEARLELESRPTWTTLIVELMEREVLLSGRLLHGGG